MRLIFMGSPTFAVPTLRALHGVNHDLTLVVTQPPRPSGRGRILQPSAVANVATELGLDLFTPDRLRDPVVQARLRDIGADAIVVASYGQILPRGVLDIPRLGCLNVHPSLLPRHRGAAPIVGALLAGDQVTGVTIMLMDPGMDTGPVLRQITVPIAPEDDQATLTDRLAVIGAELLVGTLSDWSQGYVTPAPQDNSTATVTHLVTRADAELDWSQPAPRLWGQVRAFAEWPVAFTSWEGRLLRIRRARVDGGERAHEGVVVAWGPSRGRSPTGAAVGTGAGLLVLEAVGLEGKRLLPIAEFLRGNPSFIGAQLGPEQTKSAVAPARGD